MLHERASAGTLALVRIYVFGLWLAVVWSRPLTDLAELPLAALSPLGLLHALPGAAWGWLLTPAALWTLRHVLLLALVLLVLGTPGYRAVAVSTGVLLTVFLALTRAFALFSHRETALLLVTYVLAAFPCADALAVGRRAVARSRPILYRGAMVGASLVFLLTYTLPAARRLAAGGLGIFLDGSIIHYTAVRAAEPGAFTPELGLLVLESPWLGLLTQVGFPIVTGFELVAPLCLFHRPLRRAWIAVMAIFHVTTWLTMGIFFWLNLLLIPVLVTDFERVLARWAEPAEPAAPPEPAEPGAVTAG